MAHVCINTVHSPVLSNMLTKSWLALLRFFARVENPHLSKASSAPKAQGRHPCAAAWSSACWPASSALCHSRPDPLPAHCVAASPWSGPRSPETVHCVSSRFRPTVFVVEGWDLCALVSAWWRHKKSVSKFVFGSQIRKLSQALLT